MSTALLLFLGVQFVSLVLMAVILFEHWRLCRKREYMFHHMDDKTGVGRLRAQYKIAALYIITTLLILAASNYVFFLQFSQR